MVKQVHLCLIKGIASWTKQGNEVDPEKLEKVKSAPSYTTYQSLS